MTHGAESCATFCEPCRKTPSATIVPEPASRQTPKTPHCGNILLPRSCLLPCLLPRLLHCPLAVGCWLLITGCYLPLPRSCLLPGAPPSGAAGRGTNRGRLPIVARHSLRSAIPSLPMGRSALTAFGGYRAAEATTIGIGRQFRELCDNCSKLQAPKIPYRRQEQDYDIIPALSGIELRGNGGRNGSR